MLKNIIFTFIFFMGLTKLNAENSLFISANVAQYATLHQKRISVSENNINEALYLQSNAEALSISLTDTKNNAFSPYVSWNGYFLSSLPRDLSNKDWSKMTKIGNLIISREEGLTSLFVTISVK